MLPLAVFLFIGILAKQTLADEPEAIVGGTAAFVGEFPWQVSLKVNNYHSCGGSIIAPTKILTAAHCVYGIVKPPYNNFRILTGTTDTTTGQSHAVQSVRVHPNYIDDGRYAWANDIAVITLQAPIQYNQYQSAIALADSQSAPGTLAILSGWGQTSATGPVSRALLKINQSVVSLSQCRQSHSQVSLTNTHLCAYNRRGVGACMGDSGGPLVANGKQIGIVSWSQPCALGIPDVYTNVAHHRNFIQSS